MVPGVLATTRGSLDLSSSMTTTKDWAAWPDLPASAKVISAPPGTMGASGTSTQSPLDSTVVVPSNSPLA